MESATRNEGVNALNWLQEGGNVKLKIKWPVEGLEMDEKSKSTVALRITKIGFLNSLEIELSNRNKLNKCVYRTTGSNFVNIWKLSL